jgi:hypothetical protein
MSSGNVMIQHQSMKPKFMSSPGLLSSFTSFVIIRTLNRLPVQTNVHTCSVCPTSHRVSNLFVFHSVPIILTYIPKRIHFSQNQHLKPPLAFTCAFAQNLIMCCSVNQSFISLSGQKCKYTNSTFR